MYADAGFGFTAAYSLALASSQPQQPPPPPFDYAFSSAPAPAPSLLSMPAMDHDAFAAFAAAALPVPDLPAAHLVSNYSNASALLAASFLIADFAVSFPSGPLSIASPPLAPKTAAVSWLLHQSPLSCFPPQMSSLTRVLLLCFVESVGISVSRNSQIRAD